MKSYIFLFLMLVTLFTVFTATTSVTYAGEDTGFVTCTGADECNFCSFVDMTNNIIQWIIVIATTLVVLLLAFAGFRLITSAGDASALENAKKLFVNSLIGILIMLAGWTIVDTFLKVIAGGDLGVWNVVECGGAYKSSDAADIDITLEEYESFSIEVDGEGTEAGYSYLVYTRSTAGSCKQANISNFADVASCQSSLDSIIGRVGSSNVYIEKPCSISVAIVNKPSWMNTRDCGIPVGPAGEICYPSGACFSAFSVANKVTGYSYSSGGGAYAPPGAVFIDLDKVNLNTKISKDFRLSDVAQRRKGQYAFIDPKGIARLQQVRDIIGAPININSGYRSPSYNRSVGGAKSSRHMYGDGFDIAVTSSATEIKLVQACNRVGADYVGTYSSGAHVHCDWRNE